MQVGESLTEVCVTQTVGNRPTVVRLVDVFVTGQSQKMVLERLPTSVADMHQRAHGFAERDLHYRYGRHLLERVKFVRSSHIAHRDISLNNALLCGRTNSIKLVDFGVAASAASFVLDRPVTILLFRAPEAIL